MSPQMRTALGLPPSGLDHVAASERPVSPSDELSSVHLPALAITLRVQRRLAIRTMAILLGALLLVPPLVAAPFLGRLRLAGVPVLWLLLGFLVYPVLLLLASRHQRAADRLEAELDRRDIQISG
jgi:hypothetical protein